MVFDYDIFLCVCMDFDNHDNSKIEARRKLALVRKCFVFPKTRKRLDFGICKMRKIENKEIESIFGGASL